MEETVVFLGTATDVVSVRQVDLSEQGSLGIGFVRKQPVKTVNPMTLIIMLFFKKMDTGEDML